MVSLPQIASYGAFAQFVPACGLQIKWQPLQGKDGEKRKLIFIAIVRVSQLCENICLAMRIVNANFVLIFY